MISPALKGALYQWEDQWEGRLSNPATCCAPRSPAGLWGAARIIRLITFAFLPHAPHLICSSRSYGV